MTRAVHTKIGGSVAMLLLTTSCLCYGLAIYAGTSHSKRMFRGSFSGYSVAGPRVLATGTSHSKRMFRGSFSGYSVAGPRVLATGTSHSKRMFRGSFSGYSVAGPRVLATGTSHSKRMFRGSFSGYSVASPRVLATYDQDRCVIYTNSVQSVARKGSGEGSHLISSLRERGSVHVEGEAFSMTQRKRLSPQ
ncbi:hypothetical protein J6590_040402 [Homalodisca vitripennis]|nr:hypothetical protein J6590_040402 [Homalodisca vitripennis]